MRWDAWLTRAPSVGSGHGRRGDERDAPRAHGYAGAARSSPATRSSTTAISSQAWRRGQGTQSVHTLRGSDSRCATGEAAALEERHLARERDDARQGQLARVVEHALDEDAAQPVAVRLGAHGERAHLAEVVPQHAQRGAGDDPLVRVERDMELAHAVVELAGRARQQRPWAT